MVLTHNRFVAEKPVSGQVVVPSHKEVEVILSPISIREDHL